VCVSRQKGKERKACCGLKTTLDGSNPSYLPSTDSLGAKKLVKAEKQRARKRQGSGSLEAEILVGT